MAGLSHLVDTDMVVEIMRGRTVAVRGKLTEFEGSVAVSSVSVAELVYGALRSSDPDSGVRAVRQVLEPLPVLAFDDNAAFEAGVVRAELAARGTPIGPYDVLIAAQARSAGLVLVTGNGREFKRVKGLRVENWRH